MIEIIPTNTSPETLAELSRRTELLKEISPWIQLDLDDGIFVPVISWPYQSGQWAELEKMAQARSLPHARAVNCEVHLMVREPRAIGTLLARAGERRIIAHIEAFNDNAAVLEAFSAWKAAGVSEAGLSVLLETSLARLEPFIAECDAVQLMAIAELGRQGASFEPRVTERIQELHARYPELVIALDGGVAEANIADLVRAGATRFGVGSAIMKSDDPSAAYARLRALAESA